MDIISFEVKKIIVLASTACLFWIGTISGECECFNGFWNMFYCC